MTLLTDLARIGRPRRSALNFRGEEPHPADWASEARAAGVRRALDRYAMKQWRAAFRAKHGRSPTRGEVAAGKKAVEVERLLRIAEAAAARELQARQAAADAARHARIDAAVGGSGAPPSRTRRMGQF